jgi:hypothetical protein
MKFKLSKLVGAKGCWGCRKPCTYNGARVDENSHCAPRLDEHKRPITPGVSELYGCNSRL